MKLPSRRPHVVYLSRQALDIFVALHIRVARSRFVLPSRYNADSCMPKATLNRVKRLVVERAKVAGLPLEPFTVHDLRRTGSTLQPKSLTELAELSSRKVPNLSRTLRLMADYSLVSLQRNVRDVQSTALATEFMVVLD
jgi:integrase